MPNSEIARPLAEWTEEDGDVLWWCFPIEEPPYLGSPICLGHTVEIHTQDSLRPRIAARCQIGGWPGYHTHWTPLPLVPVEPFGPPNSSNWDPLPWLLDQPDEAFNDLARLRAIAAARRWGCPGG